MSSDVRQEEIRLQRIAEGLRLMKVTEQVERAYEAMIVGDHTEAMIAITIARDMLGGGS